ncbi:MAG: glycosyltransferase family 1 protein [Paludibacter sp.]|jgi:glycosyltransferase involved in cell wall biosynthesis|nr:glycosyltransferase family 1 protein [Paludibacter sp.]
MTIGIEGQRLFRVKKHGMDIVALELIRRLTKFDIDNQYVIFVKDDDDKTCLDESPNVKICILPAAPYPVWEQVLLPQAAQREKCDILHCTSNTAPLFSNIPIITTLHDIIYLEKISILSSQGSHYQRMGNMYRRFIVPGVARKSKRIVTVSEFEKVNIERVLGYSDKLRVIHNGVGSHFVKITDFDVLNAARKKYHLPERFIFFLGNTDPKKNTINVLKAFAEYQLKHNDDLWLVMPDYEESVLQEMLSRTVKPDVRDKIRTTGYVPNTELPAIINQCTMMLYPSLRESFGIPILEGMACGVPVITSNTSSMPEIAGDAALLVDPTSTEAILEAVEKVMDDPVLASTLSEKGLQRATVFSWDHMAENYIKLYREVYAEILNN